MFWLSGGCQFDVLAIRRMSCLYFGYQEDVEFIFWLSGGCEVDVLVHDKVLFVSDLSSRAIFVRGYGSGFRCADCCCVLTSYQQFHFSVPVIMNTVKLLSV